MAIANRLITHLAKLTSGAFYVELTARIRQAALADGSAFRSVDEPAQPGKQLLETLVAG